MKTVSKQRRWVGRVNVKDDDLPPFDTLRATKKTHSKDGMAVSIEAKAMGKRWSPVGLSGARSGLVMRTAADEMGWSEGQ